MKKLTIILFVLSVIFSLVACEKAVPDGATEIDQPTEVITVTTTIASTSTPTTATTPTMTTSQQVNCLNCGKAIIDSHALCSDCYADTRQGTMICAACGATIANDSNYCKLCGAVVNLTLPNINENISDIISNDVESYSKFAKVIPSKYPMLDDTLYRSIQTLRDAGYQLIENGDRLIFNNPDPLKPNAIYLKSSAIESDINTQYPIAIFSDKEGCQIIEGIEVGCDKAAIDAIALIAEPIILKKTDDQCCYRYNFSEFYMYASTQLDQSEIVRSIVLHPKGYPALPAVFDCKNVFYHEDKDNELLNGIDLKGAFLMKYKRLLDTSRFDVVSKSDSDLPNYNALVPKSNINDSISFYFNDTADHATPIKIRIGGSTAAPYVELFNNIYMGGQREVYDKKFGEPTEINDIDETYYECVYYVKYHYNFYQLKFVNFKENDSNAYVYVTDMYKLPSQE